VLQPSHCCFRPWLLNTINRTIATLSRRGEDNVGCVIEQRLRHRFMEFVHRCMMVALRNKLRKWMKPPNPPNWLTHIPNLMRFTRFEPLYQFVRILNKQLQWCRRGGGAVDMSSMQ
jgi:hypothetical protein